MTTPIPTVEHMLQQVQDSLIDHQAQDVVIIDLREQSVIADYLVIASGRSSKHVETLAKEAMRTLDAISPTANAIEGLPQGDWAVLDGHDIILHVFRPEVREFYDLESMWAEAPCKRLVETIKRSFDAATQPSEFVPA